MRISAKDTICGLRPAKLKDLFAKNEFSTPRAAKKLGMDVIQASETLIALCEAGWICFNGTRDYIDYWMVSELGHRLLATPLVPRFPREEGHRIVAEVIEMARAINSEPERSRRIKEIRLFGSVLTGSHDETVGDVDMVVLVERRALPRMVFKELEQAECKGAPAGLDHVDLLFWSRKQILRRLKKVSRKLSLHDEDDLRALNAPYQTVYAYDVEKEREVPFDTAVKEAEFPIETAETASEFNWLAKRDEDRIDFPEMPAKAPKEAYVRASALQQALHMWLRGAPIELIAKTVGMSKSGVSAYLASCHSRQPVDFEFDSSFRATVSHALEPQRDYWIGVKLDVLAPRQAAIEVIAKRSDNRTIVGNARLYGNFDTVCDGDSRIFPMLVQIIDFALRWSRHMGKRFGELRCVVSTAFSPEDKPEPLVAPWPIEFGLLEPSMDEALRKQISAATKAWPAMLELTMAQRIKIKQYEGAGSHLFKTRSIRGREARKLASLAHTIDAKRRPMAGLDETLRFYHYIEPACQAS
jgi:predicted nucleotidyltransferase